MVFNNIELDTDSGTFKVSIDGAGTVTQAVGTSIETGNLALLGSSADYILNNENNDVLNFAADVKSLNYTDADGFVIGTVDGKSGLKTVENLVLTASGNVSQTQVVDVDGDLTLSGTGTFNLGSVDVEGSYTVDTQTTLSVTDSGQITVGGDMSISGSLNLGSGTVGLGGINNDLGTFDAGTGTVEYNRDNGTSQNIAVVTYNNLSLSGSGEKIASAALETTGTLLVNSGATLAAQNNLTVDGNLTVSGTANVSGNLSADNMSNSGTTDVNGSFTLTDALSNNNSLTLGGDSDFGTTTGTVAGTVVYDGGAQTIGSGSNL